MVALQLAGPQIRSYYPFDVFGFNSLGAAGGRYMKLYAPLRPSRFSAAFKGEALSRSDSKSILLRASELREICFCGNGLSRILTCTCRWIPVISYPRWRKYARIRGAICLNLAATAPFSANRINSPAFTKATLEEVARLPGSTSAKTFCKVISCRISRFSACNSGSESISKPTRFSDMGLINMKV